MPSYSPDVSLDTILAGVTAGTQSMLQGIVNGALQRQEIEIAKEKLKAYEKQVEAQEKAQDIAAKRLALEQAQVATAFLQNQANLAGQPVVVPEQIPEAYNLPSTRKVKKTVVTTEDIKTQQQGQLPITKDQLPQQPQKPVGETPYDRLLKKGIPKSVKAIFEQLLRSDTFKNLKKRGEIPADKRPIDLTPEELELWADTAKAPKGPKYNATYNFLKNLQKAKRQSEQQVMQPQGTITKSYTEPYAKEETKIEEKIVEEPWKIYPQVGETGEPPLQLSNQLLQSLQQQFQFVKPDIIVDSAKRYTATQYDKFLQRMDSLNKDAQKLQTEGTLDHVDIMREVNFALNKAKSDAGIGPNMENFTGQKRKIMRREYNKQIAELKRYYESIGAPKTVIDYLDSMKFDNIFNYKMDAFNHVWEKAKNTKFIDDGQRDEFILDTLKDMYGLEYTSIRELNDDFIAVQEALRASQEGKFPEEDVLGGISYKTEKKRIKRR